VLPDYERPGIQQARAVLLELVADPHLIPQLLARHTDADPAEQPAVMLDNGVREELLDVAHALGRRLRRSRRF
jgi:hypothetical protein